MDLFDELRENGVDVEDGVNRMMGNEALYRKMLVVLLGMLEEFPGYMENNAGDYTETAEKAHAIKGAAGNLSVTPLYKAYSEMLNLFREGKPEQASEVYRELLPVQKKIVACVEKYK